MLCTRSSPPAPEEINMKYRLLLWNALLIHSKLWFSVWPHSLIVHALSSSNRIHSVSCTLLWRGRSPDKKTIWNPTVSVKIRKASKIWCRATVWFLSNSLQQRCFSSSSPADISKTFNCLIIHGEERELDDGLSGWIHSWVLHWSTSQRVYTDAHHALEKFF